MNTTLLDYLSSLGDQEIAIGTMDGSSFLYFGPANDIELIQRAFDDSRKNMAFARDRAKADLKRYLVKPAQRSSDFDTILQMANDIKNALKLYEKHELNLKQFKPIEKRMVIDTYKKDVDNCLAILVDGKDAGSYWFKSEFDLKYKKENNE